MSFSLYLNSVDGNQVTNNQQIEYNVDFSKTPSHDGAYKVSVTYESDHFNWQTPTRATMFIFANLGCDTVYKTKAQYTSATPTQLIGIVRARKQRSSMVTQVVTKPIPKVTQIPANSNTNAYTQNSTITSPSQGTIHFIPIRRATKCLYKDNQFFILKSKPTNNLILVELKRANGALFDLLSPEPYTLVLTFEAI